MKKLVNGILITIEGIDGSGKSTLARGLSERLMQSGFPVVLTREPGATELGKQLRLLVQDAKNKITSRAEFLLFAADRAQHVHELILPALQNNKLVISDRMADSSLVYQGYGRGLPLEFIHSVNIWAMQGIKPDLTIYLKVPVAIALERIAARNEQLTSFEQERYEFIERLVAGFDTIFAQRNNVMYVDGQKSMDQVLNETEQQIIRWFEEKLS